MLAGEELVWRGPFDWVGPAERSIFGSNWAKEPGIYLWTIQTGPSNTVYYVGETGRSFGERFAEHTRAYLGGEYSIWGPEEFLQKRKIELWGGLWRPERKHLTGEYLANVERLLPRVVELLKSFRIFIAPMRGSERMRERVEAAIIRAIRLSDPHPLLDENLRYRPRLPSEDPVRYDMQLPAHIEGLPAYFQV
jgi:hypothetical protein